MGTDRTRLQLQLLWLAHDLGLVRVAPRPEEAEPRAAPSILTVVLRPEPRAATALADLARELADVDGRHYAYPPESIHVTLTNASGVDPDRVISDVRRSVASLRGAGGRIAGFGLSPTTAFAAVSADDRLRAARTALRTGWDRPEESGAIHRLTGGLWHATVIRLAAPPSSGLVKRLRRQPADPDERFLFHSLEVVRTNKVMAAARTTTLASFDLG